MISAWIAGAVLCTRTVLPDPLLPAGSGASGFMLSTEATPGISPISLRIQSGITPGPRFEDKNLNLIYSGIFVDARMSDKFAFTGQLESRVVDGNPLAAVRDQLMVGARYRLSTSTGFAPALYVKGGTGAELASDPPGQRQLQGAAGAIFTGAIARFHWNVEAFAQAAGVQTRKDEKSQLGGGGMLGVSYATPWKRLTPTLEGGVVAGPKRSAQFMSILGAGITIATVKVHAGVTARYTENDGMDVGGMLALIGQLGHEDLDDDKVLDREDVCPGVEGMPEYQGCTLEDEDGDTVWDRIDACPNEQGTALNAGCPAGDADRDGINDVDDLCPLSKECSAVPES